MVNDCIGFGVCWRDRGPFWRRGREHFELVAEPCAMDHDHAAFAANALVVLGRRNVRVFRREGEHEWVLYRRFGPLRSAWTRVQWRRP